MSTQKVHSAINSHLNSLSFVNVAWENADFQPKTGENFIRPTFMPGESRQVSLGSPGIERQTGVYQIDVFVPAGNGTGKAEDIATILTNAFAAGTNLAYEDVQVKITKAYQAKGGKSDPWYILPVKIHWQSDFCKGEYHG